MNGGNSTGAEREDEEEGAETEPISVAEVEKDVLAMIEADKAAGKTFNYIFDGYKHETV